MNINLLYIICCRAIFIMALSLLLPNLPAQALPQGPFVLKEMVWQSGGNPDYPLQPPLGWDLSGKALSFADMDGDRDLDLSIGAAQVMSETLEREAEGFHGEVWDFNQPASYFENIGSPTSPRFIQRHGEANPWNQVSSLWVDADGGKFTLLWDSPIVPLDLDNDGDLDFVAGGVLSSNTIKPATLLYIENIGSSTTPQLIRRSGLVDPWYEIHIQCYPTYPDQRPIHNRLFPAPLDWDGDGDLDVLVGCEERESSLFYLENIGDAETPHFIRQEGEHNPWNSIDVGADNYLIYLASLDIDADDDWDVVLNTLNGTKNEHNVMEYKGVLRYLENVGTAMEPVFIERMGDANPWEGMEAFSSVPADLDADGDWDLVGKRGVGLSYFENTGDARVPRFEQRHYLDNPLGGVDGEMLQGRKYSTLFDLDGDGDLDLLLGLGSSPLVYFENTGTAAHPWYVRADNPLGAVAEGGVPTAVNMDGDNDWDIILGKAGTGQVVYFENTGDATSPRFVKKEGEDNPFVAIDVTYPSPEFETGVRYGTARAFPLDTDGDGDLDLLVGNEIGELFYIENIAENAVTSPVFLPQVRLDIEVPGTVVPFDFDGDGDQDLITGSYTDNLTADGRFRVDGLHYFENIGTASVPVFIEREGAYNPWLGVNPGIRPAASPLDIDADGDWDLLVTNSQGVLLLFENKNLPAHERAFNWAESVVPELLPPPGEAFELPQMSLRYYAASGVYLFYHSTDGQVYLFAPPYTEWQALGTLESYAEAILAAGF